MLEYSRDLCNVLSHMFISSSFVTTHGSILKFKIWRERERETYHPTLGGLQLPLSDWGAPPNSSHTDCICHGYIKQTISFNFIKKLQMGDQGISYVASLFVCYMR